MAPDHPRGVNMQIRITDATREALRDLAKRDGRTVSATARTLIEQGLIRRRRRSITATIDAPSLPSLFPLRDDAR